MWLIDALEGAKNEIIGGVVVGLLAWGCNKFRMLLKKYTRMKQELYRIREEMARLGVTQKEHERLRAEIQRKDETLRVLEARINMLLQELEREKARKNLPP